MKFLVISEPTVADNRAAHAAEEEVFIAAMRRDGFIEQIFRRVDGKGGFTIVEAPSVDDVKRRLNDLPFVIHGCIDVRIIPVQPRFG